MTGSLWWRGNNVLYFFPVSPRPLERSITGQAKPQQEFHHNCGLHCYCYKSGRFDRSSLAIFFGFPVAALDPMPVSYQYNPGCVPAFHRVGGWGVRPATRFVRFNFAVFPAASRSLILFSGHPCRHALHLSRGERGGESARLPVLYPQAVCCHRCQFSLALRLGSSFALSPFPNFWLGYIGYFSGQ